MADITLDDVRTEVRGWLGEAWDPELTVAEWWTRLADSGWGAPTWPEQWLGKGLDRGAAAVVAPGDPRGRCDRPAGRARHAPRRADDPHPRHRRAEGALPPTDRRRAGGLVPALQRAGRRLRPRERAGQGRARRRRVDHQRPEGVDVGRPGRPTSGCCSRAPTPTRRSTRASPTSRSRWTSPGWRCGRCVR